MEKFITMLRKYLKEGIILLLIIGIGIMSFLYFSKKEETKPVINNDIALVAEEEIEESIYIDIKGEVKKPGVYKINDGSIVNDIILLAGGLTKNGTTKNINLSKKLTNEMVIIISNKKSLESALNAENTTCKCEEVDITTCINNEETSIVSPNEGETPTTETKTVEETVSKVSINTGTKEQLMTLSGIGESKALNIINYRQTNGNFKSIEEVKNVSGIGDSIFAQIKENITI